MYVGENFSGCWWKVCSWKNCIFHQHPSPTLEQPTISCTLPNRHVGGTVCWRSFQINKGSHVKYTIMAESIYDLKTENIPSFCGKIHLHFYWKYTIHRFLKQNDHFAENIRSFDWKYIIKKTHSLVIKRWKLLFDWKRNLVALRKRMRLCSQSKEPLL